MVVLLENNSGYMSVLSEAMSRLTDTFVYMLETRLWSRNDGEIVSFFKKALCIWAAQAAEDRVKTKIAEKITKETKEAWSRIKVLKYNIWAKKEISKD